MNYTMTQILDREVPEKALAEVISGITALDQIKPDWREKVTRPIRMRSTEECVLGQVFEEEGYYREGLNSIGASMGLSWYNMSGEQWGFNPGGDSEVCESSVWLWEQEIQNRAISQTLFYN